MGSELVFIAPELTRLRRGGGGRGGGSGGGGGVAVAAAASGATELYSNNFCRLTLC